MLGDVRLFNDAVSTPEAVQRRMKYEEYYEWCAADGHCAYQGNIPQSFWRHRKTTEYLSLLNKIDRDSTLVPPPTEVLSKSSVFWGVTLCKSIESQQTFRRNMLPSYPELCLPLLYTFVYCSAYSSTLKMEATCSSRTSVDFQWTTWRYIPEDIIFHNRRYDTLKSYISSVHHALSHEMVLCALSLAGPKRR
jgi:hypothetical protein